MRNIPKETAVISCVLSRRQKWGTT